VYNALELIKVYEYWFTNKKKRISIPIPATAIGSSIYKSIVVVDAALANLIVVYQAVGTSGILFSRHIRLAAD